MSGTLRGPEPPFAGAVYQARTKSGRRWEVMYETGGGFGRFGQPKMWLLRPMGDDVRTWCNEDGELQGGVREILRTTAQLCDCKKWRMVDVTERAV